MRRVQAEQTVNADYEDISYHIFDPVNYNRYMSWKAGSGSISVGVIELLSYRADKDRRDELLPMGYAVLVIDTTFKLVATS